MDALSVVLLALCALLAGAFGYLLGRAVGHKEGQDKGYKKGREEVVAQFSPYSRVEGDRVEVGYSLQLLVQGKPVLEPIDTILHESAGLKPDKQALAKQAALALGMATTVVEKAKAGGLQAKLVQPKR